MLEHARRRVRGLVKLLEKRKRAIVYTDFTDDLGHIAEVELRGIRRGTGYERFRAKARVYLREHEDHVALQKLRRNLPLTPTDLDELDRECSRPPESASPKTLSERASWVAVSARSGRGCHTQPI